MSETGCGIDLEGRCECDTPSIDVSAEPDDTPSDMDDAISVSYGYLDLLLSRANRAHCDTCSCDR